MSPAHAASACPSCRTPLPGGSLTGICAVCAWQELGSVVADDDGEEAAPDALFTVTGHDVLAEIARGGGGIVYRARQRQPRREVALKMLPPALLRSPELQARFRMEAETIATLNHAAILPVYTVGEKDGLPFFTMKLAAHGTLAARREALQGRWCEIARLMLTLAEAVHYAHTRGVVHRDLKPGNVLFDAEDRPFVSDFGLAKFTTAEPSVTRSRVVMGTPAYLAPEVVAEGAAAATTSSDVYGLGAIFYELLAGQPPFPGESIPELLRKIVGDAPAPPSTIRSGMPRDLEVICLRCLEKDPAKRLPGAAALAEDLGRWLEHRPILSRPVGAGERLAQWTRRNPALATLSLGLIVALIGGGAMLAHSNGQLRGAMRQTVAAEAAAQEALHGSLVAQARLLRTSGRRGQRHEALEVLERAAKIRPSIDVRNEVVAALVQPDLRFERTLPVAWLDETATVAFAPDFQSYVSYSGKNDFVLLSSVDGKVIRRFRPAGEGRALQFSFSGDGQRIAAQFVDRRIEIWSRTGEAPLWTLPARGNLSVAYALHPQAPLCAWADEKGQIQVRDLSTGEVRRLAEGAGRVARLRFSPDGKQLAVARFSQLVVLDGETGATHWTREGQWGAPVDLAWSADGGRLAAVDAATGEMSVLDAKTGRVRQTLRGEAMPRMMAFLPDEGRFSAISGNGTMHVWDLRSGRSILETAMPARVLAWSPDGRQLAGANRPLELGIFSWADEAVFHELRSAGVASTNARGASLDVSPDGRLIATSDQKDVRVWDAETRVELAAFSVAKDDWTSVRFHPDGRRLVYSGMAVGVFQRRFTRGKDAQTGWPTLVLGEPEAVGPNRDGRLLGFGADGRDWYVDREKIERVVTWPEGDAGRERALAESQHWDRPAVSLDGKWIVAMGYPRAKVRVMAAGSGEAARALPVTTHAGAAFSPDGRWLVTGTDAEYQLWALPELKIQARWPRQGSGGWGTPVFSPDGKWLALDGLDGAITIRDTKEFAECVTLTPPTRIDFNAAGWSRDGGRLYVLGTGQRVFEWDLAGLRRSLAERGLDW